MPMEERDRELDGGGDVDEEGRLSGTAAGAASDVADAFREVLGDAAYTTFKNCTCISRSSIYLSAQSIANYDYTDVHRFDAHAIPLDGPFGLLQHVRRLLDSAPGLDERKKQKLLDRFTRVVQENR